MTSVGYTLSVAVDPAEHNGNDKAAAIICGVHADGTYLMRVFGDGPLVADSYRDHVDLNGEAHDYTAASSTETSAPAPAVAGPTLPAGQGGDASPAATEQAQTPLQTEPSATGTVPTPTFVPPPSSPPLSAF